jgi:CRISPR-associated protein Cas1
MGTLYIDRKDIELRPEGNCLAIYERGERQRSVPGALIERVVVHGSARFTSGLLGWLSNHGTGLVVLSGWDSRQVAALAGTPQADARRRIAQYRAYLDQQWRRRWSAGLVRAKLKGQKGLLLRARGQRPDASKELHEAVKTLEELLSKLAAEAEPELGTLTGWEGAAGAAYFRGYCRLFAPALGFEGRNRGAPGDPAIA